jgi:hypothetical protein
MTPPRTTRELDRLAIPLKRRGLAGAALGGAAAVGLALAIPAWLVRLGLVRTPLWVIIAWGVAIAAAMVAIWRGHRAVAGFSDRELAVTVEGSAGWRRGAVTAVLDGATAGTSSELFAAADQDCAAALAERGAGALAPVAAHWGGRAKWAAAAAIGTAVVFVAVSPLAGPAAALWSPARAWATFIAPVTLDADRTTVDRGESVALSLRAAGRTEADLWVRGVGEGWRSERVALDSIGEATRQLGPLTGDLFVFIAAGGRTSDTVGIRVRLPAFLGSLTLTAKYPAYLGIEEEPLPTTGDTLTVPAGTRIEVSGETTAELAEAGWSLGSARIPMAVGGRGFRGTLTPRGSGLLSLELATKDGAPIGGDPIRLPIIVVPDTAPTVEVPVPGHDTMMVMGEDVALVVDVRDDHGIVAVEVATVKQGDREPVATALPLPPNTADRALLSTRLELGRFGLRPGDTLRYWVAARDNAPAGNIGQSKTFVLIVPTTTEARAEQRSATKELGRRIDSLVAQSQQLQRQTEDLSRGRQRGGAEKGDPTLGFDEAKRAEQIAAEQQELIDEAEGVRDQLAELEEAAEKGGISDSAFRARLDEIRQQLDKALTPEMRQQLEDLRNGLKNLDPQGTKDALKKLAEAQQRLKEALERTRELFKRAALEGELTGLQQETKELLQQQREWNEQVGRSDSAQAAAEEEGLAERADSVAQGLEQAAKQLDNSERQAALKESADQARSSSQKMQQAAQSAKAGKRQQAKQQGEDAAAEMSKVESKVKEQREEQQEEWRQEVLEALDRALAETARLSQRQLALAATVGRGTTISASRQEQGVIEEGVQKILEQILAVGGKNALISPQIGTSLVQARLQMARAREAVSSASANLREAAEQAGEAVDALNVAAYQMLRSRDDVAGSASGSGLAEAMQRMQQLAGQQGSLSQEGNNLLSMLMNQQLSAGQLQALAQRQRQLAQELERLRAETQAGGTRDLAEEARELARKLEAGRIDRETVERQERLFKRMLDAGRTLQGQEEDEKKERESTTAKTDSLSIPAPLRRLLDREGRIRLPSWDELQRLSPEERRLVTDYFRRLAAREAP